MNEEKNIEEIIEKAKLRVEKNYGRSKRKHA